MAGFLFFIFWWYWVLVAAHGLSYPVAHGILVARLGIKPKSSALEGRFLTAEPPRKSLNSVFLFDI